MTEKDLNAIIVSEIKRHGGVAHKIPDMPRFGEARFQSKKPFDGFGAWAGRPLYWESKFQKGYQAFNFKRIEPHQLQNLEAQVEDGCEHVLAVIFLGIWVEHVGIDLYSFTPQFVRKAVEIGYGSVARDALLSLRSKAWYLPIRKKQFDLPLLPTCLIGKEFFDSSPEPSFKHSPDPFGVHSTSSEAEGVSGKGDET